MFKIPLEWIKDFFQTRFPKLSLNDIYFKEWISRFEHNHYLEHMDNESLKVWKKIEKKYMYQEQEYFCSKCSRTHKKYRNHQVSKIYKNHYGFREIISKMECFRRDFKTKWKKESKKPNESIIKGKFIN